MRTAFALLLLLLIGGGTYLIFTRSEAWAERLGVGQPDAEVSADAWAKGYAGKAFVKSSCGAKRCQPVKDGTVRYGVAPEPVLSFFQNKTGGSQVDVQANPFAEQDKRAQ